MNSIHALVKDVQVASHGAPDFGGRLLGETLEGLPSAGLHVGDDGPSVTRLFQKPQGRMGGVVAVRAKFAGPLDYPFQIGVKGWAACAKGRLRRVQQHFPLRRIALDRVPNLVRHVLLVGIANERGEQHEKGTVKGIPREQDFPSVSRVKANGGGVGFGELSAEFDPRVRVDCHGLFPGRRSLNL